MLVADFGVGMAGEDPSSEVADAVVAEITKAGGEAIAVADDISRMESGERLIATALEKWGRIDGVVAVAGILRERMLFNMSEDEWDAVIATHLKGHFTVFRAAAAVMRKQEGGGALIGFTSGAFAGSVAQANYAAAKGGIVSLVRSAAVGLYRYGVTANAIAPVAGTRMSANVPSELAEMGDPEDVAPMVVFLLSDKAKHVTGQMYTVVIAAELEPKPAPQTYRKFLALHQVDPARSAMFEDLARNLVIPHQLGMTTVLVVPDGTREVLREDWELEGRDASHVDHVTDDLTGFLRGLAKG